MDTKSNDDSGSDSLDKSMQSKCVMVDTSSAASSEPAAGTDDCSRDSAALRETPPPPSEPKTEESNTCSSSTSSSNNNNSNISSASAAFESKVKLISQNLKETTLAEIETPASADAVTGAEEPNSTDDSDQRVKKVRFHPDVKENDGGNRVKKKRRSTRSNANHSCDGMDLDEDDDDDDDEEEDEFENDEQDQQQEEVEEEEEFNLAKTIAEAEDYLKQHPLTFVRRIEQNGERMRDGLHNVEEMPQPQMHHRRLRKEHDNEDNFYKRTRPENGIERILGKETKAGKVEFLLRYENQGGLFWEPEEYIRHMCPTLLKSYEKNRERRQQRLMHHVAKRQSMRQRYTDF
ncbi:nucleomorphin [Drosophila grimshawi]|uniref:GH10348 n=1 Tax=Drosophila grimshawi TaxID=7222 RepID=B4JA45_DROGR|nr:nucleomorphin [Drosophila grimshawi]EDW03719.1 GH10348 [Drosophila grimshawi]